MHQLIMHSKTWNILHAKKVNGVNLDVVMWCCLESNGGHHKQIHNNNIFF